MDNENLKIDKNAINKLNEMMKSGNISDIISNIPPEMMQNISSIMNNTNNSKNTNNTNNTTNFDNTDSQTSGNNNNKGTSNKESNQNSFDFINIDINTIMKMKNVMDKLNNNNDPRKNLLSSLKPYLRDSKKEKLDQYANLLNIAKIADLFQNDNKENK